jgi:hypothetical protein
MKSSRRLAENDTITRGAAMMEPFIFTSHLGKMKIIPAYLLSSSLAKGYDPL